MLPPTRRRRKPMARVGVRADRVAGLLDGLRGLPNPASGLATARQRRIAHWASAKAQRSASHYGPLLADLRAVHEQLVAHCEVQAGLLDDAVAVVERIRQQGPEGGRRFGESGLTGDQVRRRRLSEFERSLAQALASARDRQALVGSGHAAIRAAEDRLSVLEDELRSDLQRINALAGRRRANYLAGATATHPDRDALVAGFGACPDADSGEEHIRSIHLVKTEETA